MVLIIGTCLIISGTVDQWFKYKNKKLKASNIGVPTNVLSPEITELIKSECVMYNKPFPPFVSLTVHKGFVTVSYDIDGKQYSHAFTRIQDL